MGRILPFEERASRPIVFRYPTGKVIRLTREDEVMLAGQDVSELGEYVYLIQQLKDEQGEEMVRMTYYRRRLGGDDNSWTFAGQTSVTTTSAIWATLLAAALQKPWFGSLIERARVIASGGEMED